MAKYTLEQLITLNHDLRVTLLSKWQEGQSYIGDEKTWPLLYLAVQAANLHEGIEVLASKGLGREAGILLRSLLEATVNVMWIAHDPENRLDRYAAYRFFAAEQYRDLGERLADETNWTSPKSEQWDKEAVKIRKESKKAKEQYGFKKGAYWSGEPLKEMAKEVGWLQKYEAIYKIYSEVIHSSIGSSKDFFSLNDSGAVLIHGKSLVPHAEPILMEAFIDLTMVLSLVDAYAELGLETEIDKARKKVDEIVSSYHRK